MSEKLKDLKRKFVLQTKKTEGESPLYFRALKKFNGKKVDKLINTQVLVDISYFQNNYATAISMDKNEVPEQAKFIYDQLAKVCDIFDNLDTDKDFDKKNLDDAISKVVVGKSYQTIQFEKHKADEESRLLKMAEAAKRQEQENPLNFMSQFISDISNGIILRKGKPLAANTKKAWVSFQGILTGFYSVHPFTFQDVNERLVCTFLAYLDKQGYMIKTKNKYLISFHAICVRAAKENLISKKQIEDAFQDKQADVKESDKAKEIYLTTDEIQALYDMKLSGLHDKVRDVFLVGYYTCQRFSDYNRLDEDNFTTTSAGTKVVKLIQKKTGNSVTIPILNNNLLNIAKKYNYDIPTLSDVVFNRYIKVILKKLSVSVPSLAVKEVTLLTLRERAAEEAGKVEFERDKKGRVLKARYDLVSSHTARRSGITNLVLSGRFNTFQMMSISGHRDRKTFAEYIKLSSDELADEIMRMKDNEDVF